MVVVVNEYAFAYQLEESRVGRRPSRNTFSLLHDFI